MEQRFKNCIEEVIEDDINWKKRVFRTSRMFKKIHNFLGEYRCLPWKIISVKVGVVLTAVKRIIHEDLNMPKICVIVTKGRWLKGITTVAYPPYSVDLPLCKFCLFGKLKENTKECRLKIVRTWRIMRQESWKHLLWMTYMRPSRIGWSLARCQVKRLNFCTFLY